MVGTQHVFRKKEWLTPILVSISKYVHDHYYVRIYAITDSKVNYRIDIFDPKTYVAQQIK